MLDDRTLLSEICMAVKTLLKDPKIARSLNPDEMVDAVTKDLIIESDDGNWTTGRGYDAHYRLLDGSLMQVHVMVTRRWGPNSRLGVGGVPFAGALDHPVNELPQAPNPAIDKPRTRGVIGYLESKRKPKD